MELLILSIVAFASALFTFFSGFGLGTILTPVFMLFFPVEVAVALTGITHLINNLFKMGLVGKHADLKISLRFGIPALAAAFLGAWFLIQLSQIPAWFSYTAFGKSFPIVPVKFCVATLLIIFSVLELIPGFKQLKIENNYLFAGGLLSGFFGGLSGNQGAFRSAFLIKAGLSPEGFIATGVLIAVGIDITRLGIYATHISSNLILDNWVLLCSASLSAISGSFLGSKLLKKITLRFMQIWVAVMLILFSLLVGLGIL
ncbi:MAG: TSUP family transporter [Bacteroidetes bacterium]|nr:TSUP family transporter [Bacteroidota bacterium]